jgi:hypothetical protein
LHVRKIPSGVIPRGARRSNPLVCPTVHTEGQWHSTCLRPTPRREEDQTARERSAAPTCGAVAWLQALLQARQRCVHVALPPVDGVGPQPRVARGGERRAGCARRPSARASRRQQPRAIGVVCGGHLARRRGRLRRTGHVRRASRRLRELTIARRGRLRPKQLHLEAAPAHLPHTRCRGVRWQGRVDLAHLGLALDPYIRAVVALCPLRFVVVHLTLGPESFRSVACRCWRGWLASPTTNGLLRAHLRRLQEHCSVVREVERGSPSAGRRSGGGDRG